MAAVDRPPCVATRSLKPRVDDGMRLRATVAYDGTDFHGFQRQANARSVQGELEAALGRICGQAVAVVGAGRTDAGVHATGQVIAFEAAWRHTLDDLRRAANSELPEDVAVLDLEPCGPGFHPRFSARSRVYEYRVAETPTRQPLTRRYEWQIDHRLDAAALAQASGWLVGEHDFAAFGAAPQGDSTVRTVMRADWAGAAGVWRFTIEANAFLFRMVRRIVATLVRAGSGQIDPDEVKDILASGDSRRVKGAAPACGLCLVQVNY